MPETNRCPTCQIELPADAPSGLCPACLLKAGMTSDHVEAGTRTNRPSFTPPSPAELAPHFPQLEILELVGQGGMGAVYKAKQTRLDRLVALKILPRDVEKGQEFADRFSREAKAMARLSHPNIIAIHDYGETGGWFYFVMEYVDGVNLRQAMKAATIKPSDAMAMVGQICEALQYAHEESVVHRDIKPENILLTKKGRVKIADFGLAKLMGLSTVDRHLTATQQVMGTIGYMAPEQMEGSKSIDHRADIYALGVVFYELLTGELPMGRFAPPSHKVQIDVRIDDVVLKSLEREPDRRYQAASQVKQEVERISAGPATNLAGNAPAPCIVPVSEAAKVRLTVIGGAMLIVGLCQIAVVVGIVLNAMNRKQVSFNLANVAALFTVIDFVALGALVALGGLFMILRILRPFAVIGAFAGLIPLALIGNWISSGDPETLRFGPLIMFLDVVAIFVGIFGLIDLSQKESKAQFRWSMLPFLATAWRVLYPRFLNSALLTVVTCGIALAFMIVMSWSYSIRGDDRTRMHYFFDFAPSLVAVIITAGMILFLMATWPFTWRLVLWRPMITLLGGAAILASGIWYSRLFPLDSFGNATQVMFEGWVVSIIAGGILFLNGAWELARWLSAQPAGASKSKDIAPSSLESRAMSRRRWLPWFASFVGIGIAVPGIYWIANAHRWSLLGTWRQIDGTDVVTFHNDGTFDEASATETIAGQYVWLDGEQVAIQVANRPRRIIRVATRGEQLTIKDSDGIVHRFQRANAKDTDIEKKPKAPDAKTIGRLVGTWKSSDGQWTIRFRSNGTFDQSLRGQEVAGTYHYADHSRILNLTHPMRFPETGTTAQSNRFYDLRIDRDELTLIPRGGDDAGLVCRLTRNIEKSGD